MKEKTLNPLVVAQIEPEPWFDWVVSSEGLTNPSDHVTVRNLIVLIEFQYGARISSQETTVSTWIGSPALQLLELGCDPTGDELPLRDDNFTLAMSHAEFNTKSSISVSVHGPAVAGSAKGGTSYYSSS